MGSDVRLPREAMAGLVETLPTVVVPSVVVATKMVEVAVEAVVEAKAELAAELMTEAFVKRLMVPFDFVLVEVAFV